MVVAHRGTVEALLSGHDPIRGVRRWLSIVAMRQQDSSVLREAKRIVADWIMGADDDVTVDRLRRLADGESG